MKKKAINKTKDEIMQELRRELIESKRNITFSIDIDLLESFKKECKINKVSMNKVIEKLIQEFLK